MVDLITHSALPENIMLHTKLLFLNFEWSFVHLIFSCAQGDIGRHTHTMNRSPVVDAEHVETRDKDELI
jgi:hypothetical protein